jgi:hypothetical protein
MLIAAKTGATASQLRSSRHVQGFNVRWAERNGETLTTYVQDRGDGFALIARLDRPGGSVMFKDLLKPGQRFEAANNGGLVILEANNVIATVDAPWAVDATGHPLPTSYAVDGTTLVQTVDTSGAQFPVLADPSVKPGYHVVPVFYIQYTWSETWYIKNNISQGVTGANLLCTRTGPAAPVCVFLASYYGNDIKNTVEAAIAHKKCLKMRVPTTPGLFQLSVAYDAYYVTCSR